MTILIGLVGGRRSGKSTIAEYISTVVGGETFAIADSIKYLTSLVYGLQELQFYSSGGKDLPDPRWDRTPRELVCQVGDALRATYGDVFSVRQTLQEILSVRGLSHAVVSDVRYVAEARFLREAGAYLWRVHYPEGAPLPPARHDSEREWMHCDVDFEIRPADFGIVHLQEAAQAALLRGFVRKGAL